MDICLYYDKIEPKRIIYKRDGETTATYSNSNRENQKKSSWSNRASRLLPNRAFNDFSIVLFDNFLIQ